MKQNIKLKSMIAAIVVALTLNACNTGVVANKQAPHSQTNSIIVPNIVRANEHHIEKPSDEKKKEEYDKIKDNIVVDNDVNKPAKEEKKDTIHQLLAKVPTELTQQFNKLDGQIKLISDNWQASLGENGVKISSETKVINKFGKPVHISDAIVYFDPDSQAPTIYVNSNINYENNADNRRELYYGILQSVFIKLKIKLNEDFITAINDHSKEQSIEVFDYQNFAEISSFTNEDIKKDLNQKKMAILLASIMTDYVEYGKDEYNKVWPQMVLYLEKFERVDLPSMFLSAAQKYIKDIENAEKSGKVPYAHNTAEDITNRLQQIEELVANQLKVKPLTHDEFLKLPEEERKKLVSIVQAKKNKASFDESNKDLDVMSASVMNISGSLSTFHFNPKYWIISSRRITKEDNYKASDTFRWAFIESTKMMPELKDIRKLKTIKMDHIVNPQTIQALEGKDINSPEFLNIFLTKTPNGKSTAFILKEFGLKADAIRKDDENSYFIDVSIPDDIDLTL